MFSQEELDSIKERGSKRATGEDVLPPEGWVRCYRQTLENPNASTEHRIEATAGIAAYNANIRAKKDFKRWARRNNKTLAQVLVDEAIVPGK